MTNNKNYNGLGIGIIFTIVSLLLTLTLIVPIVSILPGVFFEKISKALINNYPYSNVGKLTILLLTIVFVLISISCLIFIKKTVAKTNQFSQRRIIALMSIMYFTVHSLSFYIYWGFWLDFRSDGQLIFGAVKSFPVSSFAFVFIGLLIDVVKNKAINNVNMATYGNRLPTIE